MNSSFAERNYYFVGIIQKQLLLNTKLWMMPYQTFYMFDDYTLKNAFQAKVCVMKPDAIYK